MNARYCLKTCLHDVEMAKNLKFWSDEQYFHCKRQKTVWSSFHPRRHPWSRGALRRTWTRPSIHHNWRVSNEISSSKPAVNYWRERMALLEDFSASWGWFWPHFSNLWARLMRSTGLSTFEGPGLSWGFGTWSLIIEVHRLEFHFSVSCNCNVLLWCRN